MSTTLDGWLPTVGSLVWQQMYDPQHPKPTSTIQERIAHGETYRRRRLMRVHAVYTEREDGLTRYALGEPERREATSWTESDWCVLEDAHDVEGTLF